MSPPQRYRSPLQSGHFTYYQHRTFHVLPTHNSLRPPLDPWRRTGLGTRLGSLFLRLDALWKLGLARLSIPLLIRLRRNLPRHEKFCELAALRPAFERHRSPALHRNEARVKASSIAASGGGWRMDSANSRACG